MENLNEYENMLLDYCEVNPMIAAYQAMAKQYEIENKTPEYKNQTYTFKYGNYNLSNFRFAE